MNDTLVRDDVEDAIATVRHVSRLCGRSARIRLTIEGIGVERQYAALFKFIEREGDLKLEIDNEQVYLRALK